MGRKMCSIMTGLVVLLFMATAGHATTINFDDLVGGVDIYHLTPVSNQYATLGVVFSDLAGPVGALIGDDIGLSGFSEPNVLFAWQHQSSDAGDLRLDFTVSPTTVSLDAMLSQDYYLVGIAYGPGSVYLGTYTFAPVSQYGVAQYDTITAPSAISYLLLTSHPASDPTYFGNFSIDNLSFNATPEPQSLIMLLSGVGLVGTSLRRRFKSK